MWVASILSFIVLCALNRFSAMTDCHQSRIEDDGVLVIAYLYIVPWV